MAERDPFSDFLAIKLKEMPDYNPYCMRCTGLVRMTRIEFGYWKCNFCGAEHDARADLVEASPPERTWNPLVPRGSIKWLVGKLHVSTPDVEVETEIRSRCSDPGFTPEITQECVDYAIECHHENQELYRKVMGGLT